MRQIAVIDYGSGNLHSVLHAVKAAAANAQLDCDVTLVTSAKELVSADAIILPGVGHFADCRKNLQQAGELEGVLARRVKEQAIPFLGICVGMQLLGDKGYEGDVIEGLGWISGDVRRIQTKDENLKIPHMGWNDVEIMQSHPVTDALSDNPQLYYVHSYCFNAASEDDVIAITHYGQRFAAIIGKDTMIGTQFHPEKSQKEGQAFLTGFLNWRP